MPRIVLYLDPEEMDALVRMALAELCGARDQIRFILLKEIIHQNPFPLTEIEMEGSACSRKPLELWKSSLRAIRHPPIFWYAQSQREKRGQSP